MGLDLESIQNELKTQDNLITSYPLFIVYDKKQVSADPRHDHSIEYIDHYDDYSVVAKTFDELKEHIKKDEYDLNWKMPSKDELSYMDSDDFIKWCNKHNGTCIDISYYQKIDVFKTACFTRKAAEEYIKAQKHNMTEPFIFVASLSENCEMVELREALLQGKLKYKED